MLSQIRFPGEMGLLSNLSFGEVYDQNKGFVKFSRTHITKPTGLFKQWMEFLHNKS